MKDGHFGTYIIDDKRVLSELDFYSKPPLQKVHFPERATQVNTQDDNTLLNRYILYVFYAILLIQNLWQNRY